jgi:histidinol-phosphate aminotransferase
MARKKKRRKGQRKVDFSIAKSGTDYRVPPNCLRMDLNTNLLGPNPAVTRFLRSKDYETHQYPSPDSEELRNVLAKDWKVDPSQIICGNGVDEIISLTINAFTERGDTIAYPTPSFSMYNFFAQTYTCKAVEVPLKPGFKPDIDGLIEADANVTIIASPNNPSGNKFAKRDLERLIEGCKGIMALDEAYIEFTSGSFMNRLKEFPNLIVYRTFSKAYALAGMRVGVAVATDAAKRLNDFKPPFNLNVISEAAAVAAFSNRAWFKKTVGIIKKERPRMKKALEKKGFKVHPSDANFFLCKSPIDSQVLCRELALKGILIKDFGEVPTLENHVRIGIGAKKHTDLLMRKLEEIL